MHPNNKWVAQKRSCRSLVGCKIERPATAHTGSDIIGPGGASDGLQRPPQQQPSGAAFDQARLINLDHLKGFGGGRVANLNQSIRKLGQSAWPPAAGRSVGLAYRA